MKKERVKRCLVDLGAIVAGSALVAAGISVFAVPNDIAPGGVSGLSTALAYLCGGKVSVGLWSFLLNVRNLSKRKFLILFGKLSRVTRTSLFIVYGIV